MAEISKKIRQSKVLCGESKIPYARAVVLMSLFTFTFLGAEFFVCQYNCTHGIGQSVCKRAKLCARHQCIGIFIVSSFQSNCRWNTKGGNFAYGGSYFGCLFLLIVPRILLSAHVVLWTFAVLTARQLRRRGIL